MLKAKDVAKKWGFNEEDFENYLNKQSVIEISGTFGTKIDEKDEEKAVDLYRKVLQAKADKEAEKRKAILEAQEKERRKKDAMAKMLVSSGFSFEGYRITKYSGYISGDDCTLLKKADVFERQGQALSDALVKIRIQALKELKEAAYELGCNAIIGVDFDYITFEPDLVKTIISGTEYMVAGCVICVTANGNAVVIEKE